MINSALYNIYNKYILALKYHRALVTHFLLLFHLLPLV